MIDTIYIEESIRNHPRTEEILGRFSHAEVIACDRYTEIFNRKAQNFRLQKRKPALILAKKFKNYILKAPDEYGIGSENNFYFSHMLNCIYDCRYCFLQGMYRSAHYVLFINYEDFTAALERHISKTQNTTQHVFTGYDCDSLALEPVSGFIRFFLPVFKRHPDTLFELRTKSTQIRTLMDSEPVDNIVIAYSLNPDETAQALEHKAPEPAKRLAAMEQLQQQGWKIGLRFDPLIYCHDYKKQYRSLFKDVFTRLDTDKLHSVSLGSFRLPKSFFRTMFRLYPDEVLFSSPMQEKQGMISYRQTIHDEMLYFCRDELLQYIPEEIFYPCEDVS